MAPHTIGPKYEATKGEDTAAIAKRIRSDIKDAIAKGELPKGLKTSVTINRFSGGSSIDVKVVGLPAGVKLGAEEGELDDRGFPAKWSKEVRSILAVLTPIHKSYNYDDSDSMTDYFSVRFYGSVGIDWQLEQAERADGQSGTVKVVDISSGIVS